MLAAIEQQLRSLPRRPDEQALTATEVDDDTGTVDDRPPDMTHEGHAQHVVRINLNAGARLTPTIDQWNVGPEQLAQQIICRSETRRCHQLRPRRRIDDDVDERVCHCANAVRCSGGAEDRCQRIESALAVRPGQRELIGDGAVFRATDFEVGAILSLGEPSMDRDEFSRRPRRPRRPRRGR